MTVIDAAPYHNNWSAGHTIVSRNYGDRSDLMNAAIAVSFVAFLFSISRVGVQFIPVSTNLSWASAYVILALSIASFPNLYFSLAGRNAILVLSAVFATASSLWSLTPDLSLSRGVLLILNVFVGFMLAHQLGLRRTIVLIFCFGLIAQLASVALILINHPLAHGKFGTLKGLYLHKNNLAQHSCLLYITSWVLFAAGWRRKLSMLGIVVSVVNLLLSRSGTGLLMLSFVSAVLAACASLSLGQRTFVVVFGTSIVAVSALAAFLAITQIDFIGVILDYLGKDSTFTGRTTMWDAAIAWSKEHLLLGSGYCAYWNSPETTAAELNFDTGFGVSSFHNIYLDVLVDLGVIGVSLLAATLVAAIVTAGRCVLHFRSMLWAWPLVFCCFITATGFSEYPIFWNNEFQLLLAFSIAVCSKPLLSGMPRLHFRQRSD